MSATPPYQPGHAELALHFRAASVETLLEARRSLRVLLADVEAALNWRMMAASQREVQSPRLLDAAEVAERLHVRKAAVWRACRLGKLRSVSVGRYRRFRASDVEAFASAN